jgi:hypothetical protein
VVDGYRDKQERRNEQPFGREPASPKVPPDEAQLAQNKKKAKVPKANVYLSEAGDLILSITDAPVVFVRWLYRLSGRHEPLSTEAPSLQQNVKGRDCSRPSSTQHSLKLGLFDSIHEGLQLAAAAGMTQFAQGLGLDLADTLAGDLEGLPNLFESVL